MKLGYLYGMKIRGNVNLGNDPYTGDPSTIFAPGGLRGPTLYNGTVFYVDLINGDDTKDGLTPANAFLGLQHAIDQCTDNKDDTIVILPGNLDIDGDANYLQGAGTRYGANHYVIVDKSQIHIYGPNLWNPNRPESSALYRSGAEDAPLMYVTGNNVEIAYMGMSANWTTGGLPVDANLYAAALEGSALVLDGEPGSLNYSWIHHCRFPMWWNTCGIYLWRSSANVIEYCDFEELTHSGIIWGDAGAGRPTYNWIQHNKFVGCDYGLYQQEQAGMRSTGFQVHDNIITGGINALVHAIYLGVTAAVHNMTICRNCIGADGGGAGAPSAKFIGNSDGEVANPTELLADHTSYAMCNCFQDGLAYTD